MGNKIDMSQDVADYRPHGHLARVDLVLADGDSSEKAYTQKRPYLAHSALRLSHVVCLREVFLLAECCCLRSSVGEPTVEA